MTSPAETKGVAMNRDEFIAEAQRLQREYDRTRRINIFCAVVMLVSAGVLLLTLLGCQVPMRLN